MEPYEATKIVFQRIKSLDPENASKIMGILLIQDHGEKEIIRLAFGPESLLHSAILRARKELGLVSVTSPSSPLSPFCNSLSLSRQSSFSSTSSRLLGSVNLPSPLSIPNQSSTSVPSFLDFPAADDLTVPNAFTGSSPSSSMNAAASPFYGNGELDLVEELQLQDHLSFLNDVPPPIGAKSNDLFDFVSSSGTGTDPVFFPSYYANWNRAAHLHRRSLSVSDISVGSDDLSAGLDWKPCLYFARGYCKNGTSCHFLHGGNGSVGLAADGGTTVGSPSKSTQQQRLAAQLMASSNCSYSSLLPNKCMNLLPRQPFPLDGVHKSNRERLERGDCHGISSPGSRQIYLTFPADSTFKEEDVSSYFSIFGPVQDVRIPYQQKRMFGFVTFDYPETVKLILAKGNPHFVCDARVLVKPYKEKGKIAEKHRKPQIERGDYAGFDLQHGQRILYNSPDLLWRMKLEEQADLQQVMELQNMRLMSLHLLDSKRNKYPSIRFNPDNPLMDHSIIEQSKEEEEGNPVDISNDEAAHELVKAKGNSPARNDANQSFGHNLPDSPFASPKAARVNPTAFSEEIDRSFFKPVTTSLHEISPFKSCYFQVPKFASGHETIGI